MYCEWEAGPGAILVWLRTVFDLLHVHSSQLCELRLLLGCRVRVDRVRVKPIPQDLLLVGTVVVATLGCPKLLGVWSNLSRSRRPLAHLRVLQAVLNCPKPVWVSDVRHQQGQIIRGAFDWRGGGRLLSLIG